MRDNIKFWQNPLPINFTLQTDVKMQKEINLL